MTASYAMLRTRDCGNDRTTPKSIICLNEAQNYALSAIHIKVITFRTSFG